MEHHPEDPEQHTSQTQDKQDGVTMVTPPPMMEEKLNSMKDMEMTQKVQVSQFCKELLIKSKNPMSENRPLNLEKIKEELATGENEREIKQLYRIQIKTQNLQEDAASVISNPEKN